MFIFLDESGIHKKIEHSTFVLAYIEFKNYETVEEKIKEIALIKEVIYLKI